MKYFLGTDHAGIKVRDFIVEYFAKRGIELVDLSPRSEERVDYPDFAKKVCTQVLQNPDSRGILVCGSGIGMSISANRFKGIRAGLCTDAYMAKMTRAHNDANVLVLAGRTTSAFCAKRMVKAFLNSNCLGGKYIRRMNIIDEK